MFVPAPLNAALEDSISSGKFIDTKFWAFNHLNRETGRLEQPAAVFANSAVVRSIPYLSALLDEVPEGPLDTDFPQTTEGPLLGEYEYQSDSDLSDGITQGSPPTPPQTLGQDQIPEELRLPHSRLGKTITIGDAPFVTFHAVLVYLHIREIRFKTPNRICVMFGCSCVPPASARSVYRLADKYGIHDLKELAFLEIKSGIMECNIVEETFEPFVSWYPEVRELYTSRLAQVIRSPDSPSISAAFDIKIQEYFAGKLPHAKDLVLGLFDLLTSNRIPSHPSPPESPHSTMIPYSNVNDGSWIQLRDAITRSLMTGIFLDSMFYVEDSTELRPLFFCSSIAPTSLKKISEIGKLVSMSSLHGGSERVILGCGNAIVSQDTTSQKVFVVTSGDLRTWKSILWYMYTAKIAFSPFQSPGLPLVTSSSPNPGVSHEGVDMRSVYELATKAKVFVSALSLYLTQAQIALNPLRNIAYQSIERSMTSENIVEELLSTFSADHSPIREMQHQLLRRKFWSADTQQGLRTKIEQSNGQASHYGPAMTAVFRSLIQGEWTEGTARAITRSSFHTEPDPSNLNKTLKFEIITAAPDYRNMSQEELRLTHYQRNPRTAPEVHSSNFPLNAPLSPTWAHGCATLLRQ